MTSAPPANDGRVVILCGAAASRRGYSGDGLAGLFRETVQIVEGAVEVAAVVAVA